MKLMQLLENTYNIYTPKSNISHWKNVGILKNNETYVTAFDNDIQDVLKNISKKTGQTFDYITKNGKRISPEESRKFQAIMYK
jgi:hypothetical protein